MKQPTFLFFTLLLLVLNACVDQKSVSIIFDGSQPQVRFAVTELTNVLTKSKYDVVATGKFKVNFILDPTYGKPEGYSITNVRNGEITITAGDQNGLMYGGLELAELIKIGTDIRNVANTSDQPYIGKRGIKYNIPLDVRTSSFDDSGDAAQENIGEMWNLEFWEAFFDNMARYRYNTISYWNAHPFSSMVKLEDYPDVALQNVCGTTIKPQEHPEYWNVPEMASSKIVENLKVIKKMSIDEKIVFWQKVMKHAKNRGIDVYFITWNICLNGAAVPGPNWEVGDKKGKYGISNDYKNETSIDYLRKSVKQFILNYPDLTGIGVTAGENMRTPMTDEDKEKWLWDTYGKGILDAKEALPGREVKFIHRFWWTDMKKIMKYWGDYPDQFDMSFKYAKAHIYSAVNPPFSKPLLEWMKPQGLKSWWNLRNDDIFIHRWGDHKFVSEFIKHLPYEQTAGFHMGSDGYVWGREFISKDPDTPRQLEIDKHWYRFMLWGRLGYNPNISKQRFTSLIAAKFPSVDAAKLIDTWQAASKIIPQVTRLHWRDWDYMWAPEACMDIFQDLRTVDQFRTNPTMAESGIINPFQYVSAKLNDSTINSITPVTVADSLNAFANYAIDNAEGLMNEQHGKTLKNTLLDIKSMGILGKYYADKIMGAVELEYFKQNGEDEHKQAAIKYLEDAVKKWEAYRDINVGRYHRQNLARVRTFDFDNQLEQVKKDVELARVALTYEEEPEKEETSE